MRLGRKGLHGANGADALMRPSNPQPPCRSDAERRGRIRSEAARPLTWSIHLSHGSAPGPLDREVVT